MKSNGHYVQLHLNQLAAYDKLDLIWRIVLTALPQFANAHSVLVAVTEQPLLTEFIRDKEAIDLWVAYSGLEQRSTLVLGQWWCGFEFMRNESEVSQGITFLLSGHGDHVGIYIECHPTNEASIHIKNASSKEAAAISSQWNPSYGKLAIHPL